ncbi:hypothetical protein BDN67DRAFT_268129 [Paxillus ammoniavirescens]|nr:hypothetical protein BDN67DRAFT_268129 [Paxillus ammoniavirescens]
MSDIAARAAPTLMVPWLVVDAWCHTAFLCCPQSPSLFPRSPRMPVCALHTNGPGISRFTPRSFWHLSHRAEMLTRLGPACAFVSGHWVGRLRCS